MPGRAPRIWRQCAIRMRSWRRHECDAASRERTRNPPTGPGAGAGAHLRFGHRQNRSGGADAAAGHRLACRLYADIQPGDAAVRLAGLADRQGRRNLGHQYPHRLGLCDRQLRLVDWYRPCWHADFRHPLPAEPEVAHLDQSLRGGHDSFRRGLRRHLPADPYWPPLDGLLHVPLSQHHGRLAAVPQPADLGRLRGFHLRHGFADVLVRRLAAGPGHAAGSRQEPLPATDLRRAGDGLAWFGPPLASLPVGVFTPSGLATPLVLSVHTVVSFDFAVAIVPGWHTTIFPPYFVAGAI